MFTARERKFPNQQQTVRAREQSISWPAHTQCKHVLLSASPVRCLAPLYQRQWQLVRVTVLDEQTAIKIGQALDGSRQILLAVGANGTADQIVAVIADIS
jgi:hypothetical protein